MDADQPDVGKRGGSFLLGDGFLIASSEESS